VVSIAGVRNEHAHHKTAGHKAWRTRGARPAPVALPPLVALVPQVALLPLVALLLLVALVLGSGCVYVSRHTLEGACPTALGSPVRNFCVVTPEVLWRGEAPTAADATWLVQQRVGSVLSIQLDARRAFEHARVSEGEAMASIPFYRMRDLDPLQMLSSAHVDDRAAMFLAIVSAAPKPLYVHCRAGVDRVGVLLAIYRMLIEGVSADDAIAELARFRSPWLALEKRYIRGLSEARREQILRNTERLKSSVRPLGRFECGHGQCSYYPVSGVTSDGHRCVDSGKLIGETGCEEAGPPPEPAGPISSQSNATEASHDHLLRFGPG